MLDALARRWRVSKSEVLRRAIRSAATTTNAGDDTALGALDRLQASVQERKVNVADWARELTAEREAAAYRLPGST